MADKNRTFPTEINRSFVHLGQILFHRNLGFTNVFEYSPSVYQKPFHNFLRKQVTLGRVILKSSLRAGCLGGRGGFTCILYHLSYTTVLSPK